MAHGGYKRVLAAIALCDHSGLTLKRAFELARSSGGTVTALHVVRLPMLAGRSRTETEASVETLAEYALGTARFRLDRLIGEAVERGAAEGVLQLGEPAEVILEEARRVRADAIVLGPRHHRGLARWVLGSVAERVRAQANRPVFVPDMGQGAQLLELRP